MLGGVRGGGKRTDCPPAARHRMAYEFAEFARIVAEKDRAAEAEARTRTLAVMELLDRLHAADVQECLLIFNRIAQELWKTFPLHPQKPTKMNGM